MIPFGFVWPLTLLATAWVLAAPVVVDVVRAGRNVWRARR